jgi:post-segregation antitoxin (ccd killing protein)
MRTKRDTEIKARVDAQTKLHLGQLAYVRGLDVSDLVREAIRDLFAKQTFILTPTQGEKAQN